LPRETITRKISPCKKKQQGNIGKDYPQKFWKKELRKKSEEGAAVKGSQVKGGLAQFVVLRRQ